MKSLLMIFTIGLVVSGCQLPTDFGNSASATPSPTPAEAQIIEVASLNVYGGSNNIVADSNDNIFYPNVDQGVIVRVDSSGTQTDFATYGAVGGSATIAIDSHDTFYVAHGSTLSKITLDGTVSTFLTFPAGLEARLMKVDSNGNVYYTEATSENISTNRIQKITPGGAIATLAGSVSIYCGNGSSTTLDMIGSCALSGLSIQAGLTTGLDGALYFVGGSLFFQVALTL